jgi:hypothetical protein
MKMNDRPPVRRNDDPQVVACGPTVGAHDYSPLREQAFVFAFHRAAAEALRFYEGL